jgi:BlaI family penicillinase repressor
MKNQQSELTGAQYEIVQATWNSERPLTVTELWQGLCQERGIARTTMLTWVQRLEKRGWLQRHEMPEGLAYKATKPPVEGATTTALRIMNTLFHGSPSSLVMALAGQGHIDAEEIERLRKVLDELEAKP